MRVVIPEKEIEFELDEISINQYKMVSKKPSENGVLMEKYTVGEPITVITGNMPKSLKIAIEEVIKNYCNH